MLFGGPPDIEKLKASRNVAGLIKALAHRDQSVASRAAAALADLGDAAAVEPLMAALDRENGPHLAAVKALGTFLADPRTLRPLVSAGLLDKAPDVRQTATDYLAKLGSVEPVREEIAKRLRNLQEHLIVTPALVTRMGFDVVEMTLSTLKTEAGLRAAAGALLSKLAGAEVAGPVLATFKANAHDAQRRAAHELAKLIDRSAVEKLNAALKDENEDVRGFAAMVLLELNNPLVAKLVSNYEPLFLDGLREAVTSADAGNYDGVKALREAIRVRSGKPDVTFYEAGIVSTVGFDRYTEARPKIVALAARRALLEDPYGAGDLVSAAMFSSAAGDLEDLVRDVFAVGGADQGYAFQLLYNELRSTARFKLAGQK